MLTKKRIEFVNCKEFAIIILNPEKEIFIVYIALLEIQDIVNPSCRAQITLFIANKVLIKVHKEYAEYANIFYKESAVKLSEYKRINNHLIDLKKDK